MVPGTPVQQLIFPRGKADPLTLWTWLFLQNGRIFPGVHTIGAAISGPRMADKNFTDTRTLLNEMEDLGASSQKRPYGHERLGRKSTAESTASLTVPQGTQPY